MRILLVEDEEQIRKVVKMNLELEGYEVISTDNGKKALDLIDGQYFDLLILDIMLPEVNGLQICEKVRLKNKRVGIIIVSAKDTASDKIAGLKLGADDYLTKPFNLEELLLRVNNLIVRSSDDTVEEINAYAFGDNEVNFATYEANNGKESFQLTQKETLLMKMLIERKNQVVDRKEILQNVWGYDVFPTTRTIDNFILSFRKYFEKDPKNPEYFISIRGVGYKFVHDE